MLPGFNPLTNYLHTDAVSHFNDFPEYCHLAAVRIDSIQHPFIQLQYIRTIFIIGVMLLRVFRGPSVFDRLNGMFVIGLDVIVVLLLVGYTDGREAMYIDIAVSYGVLGFITSVIVAKFMGGKEKHDD